MNKQIDNKSSFLVFAGIVIIAAFSRLIPHPWNLTPVGAMAIFSGAYLTRNWLMYAIPLFAYWVSDLVVMNTIYAAYYDGFQWLGSIGVYIALAAIILISSQIFKSKKAKEYFKWSIPTALVSSVVFFLISNFSSFLIDPIYPKNIAGLMSSYVAGLPFFQNTLSSFVFYSVVLFGVAVLFQKYFVSKPAIKSIA